MPTTGYVSAPSALNVFDEYGVNQPIDPASLQSGSTYSDSRNLFINNYGSLGQAQRETTDTGIQFMGARGYNPITGQFLTPDSIRGGNETPYNYPNEPIGNLDLSGLLGFAASTLLGGALSAAAWSLTMVGCVGLGPICLLVAGTILAGGAGALAAGIESTLDGDDSATTAKKTADGFIVGALSRGLGLGGRAITRLASPIIRKSGALRLNINPMKVGKTIDKVINKLQNAKSYIETFSNFYETGDFRRSFLF
jgi:RHS repeat-associated protein